MLACNLASYKPVETTQTGGGERHQFLTKANINTIHSYSSISGEIQEKFRTDVGKPLKTFVSEIKEAYRIRTGEKGNESLN